MYSIVRVYSNRAFHRASGICFFALLFRIRDALFMSLAIMVVCFENTYWDSMLSKRSKTGYLFSISSKKIVSEHLFLIASTSFAATRRRSYRNVAECKYLNLKQLNSIDCHFYSNMNRIFSSWDR